MVIVTTSSSPTTATAFGGSTRRVFATATDWNCLEDGGLQITSNGVALADFASGQWSSVERSDPSYTLDISGQSIEVPIALAKEIWNELGVALNRANDPQ
jgi:hypothetical protein